MPGKLTYILFLLICFWGRAAFSQSPTYPTNPNQNYPGNPNQRLNLRGDTSTASKTQTADQLLDTLRKRQEHKKDSVVYNSKFIKVTNERFLRDSTQLFPLDTGIVNFENYSPLYKPRSPMLNLGNLGLAERPLLFEPSHTIGFDVGLHSLDAYWFNPQDVNYYRARVPYTQLSLVTGGKTEQVFKLTYARNVNPQLNFGFNLNYIGSRGFYSSDLLAQNVSDVNAVFFSWYQSKNKRYNLLANLIYNNLKSPETGSILSADSIYTQKNGLGAADEQPRLTSTFENWAGAGFYVKQTYYIGHIDTTKHSAGGSNILPTQRVAFTFNYNARKYNFLQNEQDLYQVFPDYYYGNNYGRDSLEVKHLQNDFSYSFYLRSKSIKNELKLDVGLTQDIWSYGQYVRDTTLNQYGVKVNPPDKVQGTSFQDLTLKGKLSYRFSDRVLLEGNLQQIVQGRDFGDFFYDAKLTLAGGAKTGRIIFEGYSQSSAPPLVYTDWISNHFIFHNKFSNQKTNSISFSYINNPLKLDLKAEYFLISDYLYFQAQPGGIDATPTQLGSSINFLKVSLGKTFEWHRWHLEDFVVYQKSDYQNTIRTPQLYNYTSLYYKTFLFNVLYANIGMDVRYNSQYVTPAYAPGLGEFYNGPSTTFSSYPVAGIFIKGTLQHTNFFVMYDYVNQGLLSPGYYTVYKYPQMQRLLKIGVSWAFYN